MFASPSRCAFALDADNGRAFSWSTSYHVPLILSRPTLTYEHGRRGSAVNCPPSQTTSSSFYSLHSSTIFHPSARNMGEGGIDLNVPLSFGNRTEISTIFTSLDNGGGHRVKTCKNVMTVYDKFGHHTCSGKLSKS